MKILRYHDAPGRLGVAESVHDYYHPTFTGAETDEDEGMTVTDSPGHGPSESHAVPDAGSDPYRVGFAYAMTVAMVVTAGLILALTGAYLIRASLFLLGVLVTLVGAGLYGLSLPEA